MTGYSIGINNGFMCPNDARQLENMDLIPEEKGGNNFMVNGNMVKLEDAGAAYNKEANTDSTEEGGKDAQVLEVDREQGS